MQGVSSHHSISKALAGAMIKFNKRRLNYFHILLMLTNIVCGC